MHPFKPLTSDELISTLGLTIKHDEVNKLIVFLAALSAYTESSQLNISFNGPSSAGKSFVPLEVARYFPQEDVVPMAYCSPTAFFHDVGVYNKERNEYVVDLSRKIIIFLDQPHTLLLQHLRPLLSHDRREIGLKITDKAQKAGLKTKNIILKGFPVVVFCTAGFKLDDQEKTRFILLSPETSQEKIRESIQQSIRKASGGKAFEQFLAENPERNLLMERIRVIKEEGIEDIKVSYPDVIEAKFFDGKKMLKPRHQRDIGRVIALVKVFALLNLWRREREGQILVANNEDIQDAFKVWSAIGRSQEMGISPHVLRIFEEVIVPAYAENEGRGLSKRQIMAKHFQVYERQIPSWQLRQDILPELETAGLIREEQDPNDKRQHLAFPIIQQEVTPAENNCEMNRTVAVQQANNLASLKAEYMDTVQQLKSIETYIDDDTIPEERRKERYGDFERLVAQVPKLKKAIESLGYEMSPEEVLNGFTDNKA